MSNDEEYGDFWNIIYNEYETSKRLILKLSNLNSLMENEPVGKASIAVRESIVLPLITIQQYALKKIQEYDRTNTQHNEEYIIFEKMITRAMFGNINASRNSA